MGLRAIHDRIRSSELFHKLTRLLQFLSSIISLGLFSSRLYKIHRLSGRLSTSNGAVEGILAAAVVYTLIATLLQLRLRGGASNSLRWLLVALDIAFVGAFIAVADQTRPHGGPSGPCVKSAIRSGGQNSNNAGCRLPYGTFVLAIVSTVLHALTAIFHHVRDGHRDRRAIRDQEKSSQIRGQNHSYT